MKPRARTALFAVAAVAMLPSLLAVAGHMPAFGAHPSPYGEAINANATAQRHIQNMVTALNFDYRGFDTLGEEFILLCAVTGVSMLLRGRRGETVDAKPGRVGQRPVPLPSPGVTLIARLFGGIVLVAGLSVSLHAATTPGGGFQGGVMIASALLLIYLGEGYAGWRKLVRAEPMDALEAAGAAIYVACGLAGLALGVPFMTNVLPFGSAGSVWSGGLVAVINVGVTLAVAGGFTGLFIEFLEETRVDPGLDP